MCSRFVTLIVFAAVVAAQSGKCQDSSADAEGDQVTLLQTPLQADHVTKAEETKAPMILQTSSSLKLSKPFPDLAQAGAEYVAMTLFVVIGCGSAMANKKEDGWVLQVALTFGFAIAALAYAIGHYSGGQMNCAVTLGLVLAGQVSPIQGLLNFAAQMLGSTTGALILTGIFSEAQDKTGGLGCNKVADGVGKSNAFLGEFVMTFLLMFVILETAVNPSSKATREMAALAIGFAVFLAHSVLINIDGCSINPTRSFGPALVRKLCCLANLRTFPVEKDGGSFEDMWVFWAGPLLGASAAVGVSAMMLQ